jgi:hypothetical protein
MKKNILSLSAIALIAFASVFTGCKKTATDTVAPVITVVGANPYYIQKLAFWSDPGATASDDVDGTVVATGAGTVTTSTTGAYTVTYTATDKAGNTSTLTRTVNVVDVDGYYATVVDVSPYPSGTNSTYNETAHLATDGSGKVNLTKFGDYTNGSVYFNMTSPTALTVPSQTVVCGAAPAPSRTFQGSGTISTTAPQIVINFTEVTNGTTITSQDSYTR